MKIEPLASGCLKIWMTDADMQQWGLRFEDMDAEDSTTRTAMMKLLHIAEQRTDTRFVGGMTVEAVPMEGGCLLLFTPRQRRPLFRMPLPQIYALHGADDLLLFGAGLTALDDEELPMASLYRWGEEYRLILYPGLHPLHESRRLLSEFADKVGEGAAAAAWIEEHGAAVTVGNALHLLREAHAAPRPAPPRQGR